MSRDKGANYERELVNAFKDKGLTARRTALSGALAHEKGDVLVTAGFDGKTVYRGECKRRAALPKFLTESLGDNDFLALRCDRGETLIVVRLDTLTELLQ